MGARCGAGGRRGRSVRGLAMLAAGLLILGCAYGKLRDSQIEMGQVHDFIEKNASNLAAYYSGEREKPGAILLDLKGDNIALSPEGWQIISSKDELLAMVDSMIGLYYGKMRGQAGTLGPRLQRVLDRNDNLIGYFFSPMDGVPVRPEGEGYRVDPVTYVDVRTWSMGEYRSPGRKSGGSGR